MLDDNDFEDVTERFVVSMVSASDENGTEVFERCVSSKPSNVTMNCVFGFCRFLKDNDKKWQYEQEEKEKLWYAMKLFNTLLILK